MDLTFFQDIDQRFRREAYTLKDHDTIRHTRHNFIMLGVWLASSIFGIAIDSSSSFEPWVGSVIVLISGFILFVSFIINKLLHEIRMTNFALSINHITDGLRNIYSLSKQDTNITHITTQLNTIDDIIHSLRQINKQHIVANFPQTLTSIYQIIIELQSQLQEQITGCIAKIQQTKDDVNRVFTERSDLVSVANAQQARLDRQIEQFEELQKILVKI